LQEQISSHEIYDLGLNRSLFSLLPTLFPISITKICSITLRPSV
jgi:hypothetical protein